MGNLVEIKVSRELAEWILEVVRFAPEDTRLLIEGVEMGNRMAATSAIESGLRAHSRKPRVCERCGQSLYITGYGRPVRYCSDACKQASYRDRKSATV